MDNSSIRYTALTRACNELAAAHNRGILKPVEVAAYLKLKDQLLEVRKAISSAGATAYTNRLTGMTVEEDSLSRLFIQAQLTHTETKTVTGVPVQLDTALEWVDALQSSVETEVTDNSFSLPSCLLTAESLLLLEGFLAELSARNRAAGADENSMGTARQALDDAEERYSEAAMAVHLKRQELHQYTEHLSVAEMMREVAAAPLTAKNSHYGQYTHEKRIMIAGEMETARAAARSADKTMHDLGAALISAYVQGSDVQA